MAQPRPGEGQGVGLPRQGEGGRDLCICPNCGQIHQHPRGKPCMDFFCVRCGSRLVGYYE